MDLNQFVQEMLHHKNFIKSLYFIGAALFGSLVEVLLIHRSGKPVTWDASIAMMIGGAAASCAMGYFLDSQGAPGYVIYPGCFLSGMSGLSLVEWIHMKISKRNFGETLRQIIELLFKK